MMPWFLADSSSDDDLHSEDEEEDTPPVAAAAVVTPVQDTSKDTLATEKPKDPATLALLKEIDTLLYLSTSSLPVLRSAIARQKSRREQQQQRAALLPPTNPPAARAAAAAEVTAATPPPAKEGTAPGGAPFDPPPPPPRLHEETKDPVVVAPTLAGTDGDTSVSCQSTTTTLTCSSILATHHRRRLSRSLIRSPESPPPTPPPTSPLPPPPPGGGPPTTQPLWTHRRASSAGTVGAALPPSTEWAHRRASSAGIGAQHHHPAAALEWARRQASGIWGVAPPPPPSAPPPAGPLPAVPASQRYRPALRVATTTAAPLVKPPRVSPTSPLAVAAITAPLPADDDPAVSPPASPPVTPQEGEGEAASPHRNLAAAVVGRTLLRRRSTSVLGVAPDPVDAASPGLRRTVSARRRRTASSPGGLGDASPTTPTPAKRTTFPPEVWLRILHALATADDVASLASLSRATPHLSRLVADVADAHPSVSHALDALRLLRGVTVDTIQPVADRLARTVVALATAGGGGTAAPPKGLTAFLEMVYREGVASCPYRLAPLAASLVTRLADACRRRIRRKGVVGAAEEVDGPSSDAWVPTPAAVTLALRTAVAGRALADLTSRLVDVAGTMGRAAAAPAPAAVAAGTPSARLLGRFVAEFHRAGWITDRAVAELVRTLVHLVGMLRVPPSTGRASDAPASEVVRALCEVLTVAGRELDRVDPRACEPWYRRVKAAVDRWWAVPGTETEETGGAVMTLGDVVALQRVLALRRNKWIMSRDSGFVEGEEDEEPEVAEA
ncbi:hypothetical protein HDU96_010988 [Phlyctochytrium bullatum]|nr:hypothetical protein HDU96_010988 [Phlyctochytrium bullatum]